MNGLRNGLASVNGIPVEGVFARSIKHLCFKVTDVAAQIPIPDGVPVSGYIIDNPDDDDAGAEATPIFMGGPDVSDTYKTAALSSLDIDTITWVSDNLVDIAFNGTPDLSGIAEGDYLVVSSAGNASNNGTFRIVAVDDDTDTVQIENAARTDDTDDEATDSPAVANIEQSKRGLKIPSGGSLPIQSGVSPYLIAPSGLSVWVTISYGF